MSSRIRHAAWLFIAITFIGCQSTGRMARGPQPASPPAQARNQPPARGPQAPPQGVASTAPVSPRSPGNFPAAPTPPASSTSPTSPGASKTDEKLVIRATGPSDETQFSPSDAHHPAAPPASPASTQPADRVRELYEQAV